MEVSKLPISATQRGKLISAGYTSLSSICSASSSDISRGTQTAWDMLQEEQESLARITTSCADLDNILGGGIGCREVTEIGGDSACSQCSNSSRIWWAWWEGNIHRQVFRLVDINIGSRVVSLDLTIKLYTEQSAVINYLDKFVSEHKDVKVVIIDSIAFHFRHGFVDLALRTRVLSGIALKLMNLAKKFSLAGWQNPGPGPGLAFPVPDPDVIFFFPDPD
ncbi:DNA repair protein RAD51 [Citrus sinensis]|uniref:DNA repair protein RAD51 n=1 Tax=Citrus sinensis TaxID=2711 RepID=A0ACB8MRU7_CITSI|nr:DNA repair protein RAD51 [Citrus sinensis]KAH9788336.1 DNA repair protein RAD51 [Citrus sinensis]